MAKFSNLTLLEVRNRLDSWPLCKKNLVGSHWVEYLTIVTIIYTIVILPHIYIFEITSIAKSINKNSRLSASFQGGTLVPTGSGMMEASGTIR